MSGQDALFPLIQSLSKVYAQDDPELIQIIKQKYLIPPSDGDYNIHAEQDTSMGQAQTVRKILNNKVSTLCPTDTRPTSRPKFFLLKSIFLSPDSNSMTHGTWQIDQHQSSR